MRFTIDHKELPHWQLLNGCITVTQSYADAACSICTHTPKLFHFPLLPAIEKGRRPYRTVLCLFHPCKIKCLRWCALSHLYLLLHLSTILLPTSGHMSSVVHIHVRNHSVIISRPPICELCLPSMPVCCPVSTVLHLLKQRCYFVIYDLQIRQ
jgi:hypothetical protein